MRNKIRLIAGSVVVALAVILLVAWLNESFGSFLIDLSRRAARGGGWAGVGAYVLLFVAASFLFISATALSVIAPIMFGPWMGFVAILAGNMAASVAIFHVTRSAGNRWTFLNGLKRRWPAALLRLAHGNGSLLVFYARLLMLPASAVNYGGALLPLTFPAFLLGTFLGALPHCLATALAVGIIRDALLARSWAALARWETGLLAATYAITWFAAHRIRSSARPQPIDFPPPDG